MGGASGISAAPARPCLTEMPGPQVENGYTPIANELLDAILRYPFSKRHLNVVLAVMRKTYGYQKKADQLSASQIANMTNIPRQHVVSAIQDLARAGVVLKRDGGRANCLSINKNYAQWRTVDVELASPKTGQSQNRTGVVPKQDTQKKNIKSKKIYRYTDDFEQAWSAYPKRSGGNPKPSAFRAWNARIRDGATPVELADGVRRYAAYCEATGKAGTEYVKQAATFFGPDEHFREGWDAPTGGTSARGFVC